MPNRLPTLDDLQAIESLEKPLEPDPECVLADAVAYAAISSKRWPDAGSSDAAEVLFWQLLEDCESEVFQRLRQHFPKRRVRLHESLAGLRTDYQLKLAFENELVKAPIDDAVYRILQKRARMERAPA